MEKTTESTNKCMEKTQKEPERRNKNENKDDEKAGDRYTEEEVNHHFDLFQEKLIVEVLDPLKTVSATQSRFAKDIKDMDQRISILTNLFKTLKNM